MMNYNVTSQTFTDKVRNAWVSLTYNETTQKVDFSAIILTDGGNFSYWVRNYGDMNVSKNTIRGKFYVQRDGYRVDDFTGMITFDNDKFTLVSNNGKYRIEGYDNLAMNQKNITPTTMSLLNWDHTINWSNVIELRQKGEDLTWSDFEDYKGEDVSSVTPDSSQTTIIYKIIDSDNTDYQIILHGSKDSKPSITLQNADTGAAMDLRGDGSIYDFVAANQAGIE